MYVKYKDSSFEKTIIFFKALHFIFGQSLLQCSIEALNLTVRLWPVQPVQCVALWYGGVYIALLRFFLQHHNVQLPNELQSPKPNSFRPLLSGLVTWMLLSILINKLSPLVFSSFTNRFHFKRPRKSIAMHSIGVLEHIYCKATRPCGFL